jgi:hypothetical protein
MSGPTITINRNPGITFEQAQRGYEQIKRERRKARETYRSHLRVKAQKNHDHAKAMALAFAKHRGEGKPVEESKILAKADAAHLELDRDLADAEAKAALAHLEELEASRASLRQMADWTREES